ncbi:MAG: HD domain-containing protein [Nitrosopumilus sp.]|nr:HD domain-containing protein [Nitrosopumilus sp.]MDH3489889.1 HD domain-containing protein [Nitrosopumilus sp.]MDH3516712.1 HD domain-containing protein [Nitrosopumilus sp.]MDH3564721.1 HD domain-containing protein [Nitrosopumilus sp.]MDH5417765.1 HD domain-containing protein [Nitrosopumilus sp.]
MDLLKKGELFAKKKHYGMVVKDSTIPYSKHLEDVVNRLKSLGVIDEEILCAGWLHEVIDKTSTSFDDLFEQFGSKITVLVSSVSKDPSLTRKQQDAAYVKQIKESSIDSKLILLCDISANLSDLKNTKSSKSKKLRILKQKRHYLTAIKNDLIQNSNYPKIIPLIETINDILKKWGQRRIFY